VNYYDTYKPGQNLSASILEFARANIFIYGQKMNRPAGMYMMSNESSVSEDLSEASAGSRMGSLHFDSQDYMDSASEGEGEHREGAGEQPQPGGDHPDVSPEFIEEDVEEDAILPDIPKPATSMVAQVIRVPRDERRTSARMSLAEYSSLVSARTNQIEAYGRSFSSAKHMDAAKLARAELLERKCPLLLVRAVGTRGGNSYEEVWDPNEMIHPIIGEEL